MKTDKFNFDKHLLFRWMIANFLGCFLGLILAIVFSYAVVNIFHPEETNLILGLGYGVGIGFAQWYILKSHLNLSKWWILASALGIGIPFATIILLEEGGYIFPEIFNIDGSSIGLIFFLSGIIVGFFQMKMISSKFSKSYLWVLASCLAWGIALSLNSILFFGVIIGLITAITFAWGLKVKHN